MFHATTIVAVKRGERAAIGGDGQVTFGQNTIIKHTAKKIRRLYNGRVLIGFAGSVSDAFTLAEKFEGKLEQHGGNLKRAAVELAQEWRMDKMLRKLEAMMIVLDNQSMLLVSGTGEVIEPDDDVIAIGSGGSYAMAAAKALYHNTELSPTEIVEKALKIASSICVYTNDNISVQEL